uniref:Uncharacterized protein n=1 Tax=Sphaerodactylus townsendi TaxID=933632 RepID=A0ACB8EX85_9SAUR
MHGWAEDPSRGDKDQGCKALQPNSSPYGRRIRCHQHLPPNKAEPGPFWDNAQILSREFLASPPLQTRSCGSGQSCDFALENRLGSWFDASSRTGWELELMRVAKPDGFLLLSRLERCRMALPLALLALSALAGALSQPDLCEYETNKIKDLLQASCAGKGLALVPSGLDNGTGILLLGSNRLARVSTASFRHLRNLTDLDLSHNGMGELEAASPLPGLQELDLSYNALKRLPALQGFPNLRRLSLGHNALSWLPTGGFRALGGLTDLELQGNRLQSLPEGAFSGLAALKDLDLSENLLTALPPELLVALGALHTLRLERNRLQAVPEGFFPEGQLFAYVYLAGNPWLCDCALEYLRDWIVENEFSVYTRVQGPEKEITENEPESVTCQEPPEVLGQPVMTFHLDCVLEGPRGGLGDEKPSGLQGSTSGPSTSPDVPSAPLFPTTSTASPTRPEPLASAHPTRSLTTRKATPLTRSPTTATPNTSPTTLGSLPSTVPTTVPMAAAATSPSPTTLGSLPSTVPTAATATSPSPTTLGSLPSTVPIAAAATSPSPTTLGSLSPTRRPGSTAHLPPPPAPDHPAYCQCPMLPGRALGLTRPQPLPVSWGAWLAATCCPLRLVLYVACLALVSLSILAVLCWWAWMCVGTRGWSSEGAQPARHQQLQHAACDTCHVPRAGYQPLPRARLYRVCKKLEIGPLRYVTWLLISLPGPSGQWPWERTGRLPSYRLDRGEKEGPWPRRVKHASSTL